MAKARRDPKQQRSRDRFEAIVAATYEIVVELGVDALTVREVARRSGIASSTIYHYVADRDDLTVALLNREMETLDNELTESLSKLQVVSLRSLLEASLFGHLRHHQANPAIVPLWFSEPRSPVVAQRVREKDERLAEWFDSAARRTGMVREDAPNYHPDMITRLGDRALEYVLTMIADHSEQERQLGRFLDMIDATMREYATPAGIEGIPAEAFLAELNRRSEPLVA
ncbi:MAG: TetR/AcrR family transcriptional regulator [Actinobacteria bacterium]|nr:TetR/AcrR family transcriptional regulator [Actinomycetota bacterium]